jgi:hypothetical protein
VILQEASAVARFREMMADTSGAYAFAGTLHYTTHGEPPDYGAIVKRRLTDTGYGDPELLRGGINSESPDAHPFIAPDGSFILFDSYRDDMTGIRSTGTYTGSAPNPSTG